jgi:hypothetical protein
MTGTSDRFGSTAVDPQLARERRRPAASGLMHRSKKALFDYFVGASEQQGRQLQAELPVQFFGSRQTQIPLYSGFLAPTFANILFPGRGIYGAITVAQDLLANFSDQSANEQSYLPLKQLNYAGEVISFRAA